MLSVANKPIMLSVFMLSAFMLSVVMRSIFMLSVFMLSVVEPKKLLGSTKRVRPIKIFTTLIGSFP